MRSALCTGVSYLISDQPIKEYYAAQGVFMAETAADDKSRLPGYFCPPVYALADTDTQRGAGAARLFLSL